MQIVRQFSHLKTLKIIGKRYIPAEIRKFLHIKKGDRILFEIDNKNVVLKKIEPFDAEFAMSLESTLSSEWNSPEDDEAYNDL